MVEEVNLGEEEGRGTRLAAERSLAGNDEEFVIRERVVVRSSVDDAAPFVGGNSEDTPLFATTTEPSPVILS